MTRRFRAAALAMALAVLAGACGQDGDGGAPREGRDELSSSVRLLTHDSFALSEEVLRRFTDETGIEVELLQGGDAGTVVNQAILASGNPQADVLFGVDSTFLTRALEADLFLAYESPGLAEVDPRFVLDPQHRFTPVDYGDVCVNYDRARFDQEGLAPPEDLDDLVDPAYEDLLVVENPATSSPGLAFLLATVAAYGEDGWQQWWRDLRANGVEVAAGWEDAYYGSFSGSAGSQGNRPLVVSYATSPAAEVIYADPPVEEAPTGVVTSTCFRQVEGAGILRGTEKQAEAALLVDFLLSPEVQADIPLSMFVLPVRSGTPLPEEFPEQAVEPAEVLDLDPAQIAEGRDAWIDEWTDIVLR